MIGGDILAVERIILIFVFVARSAFIPSHLLQISESETQNFKVTPGINYEYLYFRGNSSNGSKPSLLFLHCFLGRHQIEYFSRQEYDYLAPNMMGYGKTYSPLNKYEYKSKSMVEHLITFLNHLQINQVIVIGLISGSHNSPVLFDDTLRKEWNRK